MRGRICETALSAAHLPTAIVQNQLLRDRAFSVNSKGYNPSQLTVSEFRFWNTLKMSSKSRTPVVRVACRDMHPMIETESTLDFPVMPSGACWNSVDSHTIPTSNITHV
jgi:hypothetical protein